jgi:hypothetical protein
MFFSQLCGPRATNIRRHQQFGGEAIRLSLNPVRYVVICFAQCCVRVRPKSAHDASMQEEVRQFMRRREPATGERIGGTDERPPCSACCKEKPSERVSRSAEILDGNAFVAKEVHHCTPI